jgi:hypothetical protein
VGADVKVAGCFPNEATCKRIFTSADTYDLIEACHFRSPVHCYNVIDGDRVRPQCFARMDACAGHWQVTKDHGSMAGGAAGPGCFERKAPGTGA